MRIAQGWMAAALVMGIAPGHTDVKTREVEYQAGGTKLQGMVAWNDTVRGKRPGVLVVHEWWGQNEYVRNAAKRLAEAGYVGFAVDMFGEGKVTTHREQAQEMVAQVTKDPAVLVARFRAALEQLQQDPHVDPERVAAIGYCFGGSVVLMMARSGADLDAVVSFHGGLGMTTPPSPGEVKARLLILAGANDPFVPPEQVAEFEKELREAGATYKIVTFPGTKHAFTNPNAGSYGMDALAYDADAAAKSWAAMLQLFDEVW